MHVCMCACVHVCECVCTCVCGYGSVFVICVLVCGCDCDCDSGGRRAGGQTHDQHDVSSLDVHHTHTPEPHCAIYLLSIVLARTSHRPYHSHISSRYTRYCISTSPRSMFAGKRRKLEQSLCAETTCSKSAIARILLRLQRSGALHDSGLEHDNERGI